MDTFWNTALFSSGWKVFEEKLNLNLFSHKMWKKSLGECFKIPKGYDWLWHTSSWSFKNFTLKLIF